MRTCLLRAQERRGGIAPGSSWRRSRLPSVRARWTLVSTLAAGLRLSPRSSALVRLVSVLVLVTLICAGLNGAVPARTPSGGASSPSHVGLLTGDNLPSWNSNVTCGADLVLVQDVLGSAYPSQALIGSRYQTNASAGGIPNKRALHPSCTLTNKTGQTLSTFVEVHGVYLPAYPFDKHDCSHGYNPVNGGGPYPNHAQFCDAVGDVLAVGTAETFGSRNRKIHVEIDQDWLAKGFCGSQVSSCNNVSALEYLSAGAIALDLQGFVFWDDDHWEIHPLTGMRLSRGFLPTAEPTLLETMGSSSTRAVVKVLGNSNDPVSLSVTGCPANVVCTLSPSSGTPTYASSLWVNTSGSSPRGSYNLSVAATNASLARNVTVRLVIGDRDSLSFRRGDGGSFSAVEDTWIFSGQPDTNFGADARLRINGDCNPAGTVCKSMIKFPSIVGPNFGQVPGNSTIVNATLGLFITNKGSPEGVYQLTAPWTESTATWNVFTPHGVPANLGNEFTIFPSSIGPFLVNLTTIVQRWTNGSVNQGLLLASTGTDGVDYNSSEAGVARPTLRVEFLPPPAFGAALAYDMETLTADGKMKDLSGKGRHGTLTGTADIAGMVGRARHFNGTSDKITATPSLA